MHVTRAEINWEVSDSSYRTVYSLYSMCFNQAKSIPCAIKDPMALLLRLPVGRGGVINSPRFYSFSRVEIQATAHG